MSKYTLKYKTFDELLAEVKSDFENFNLEDLIKPYQLIKVAKRVNKDLGLRIHKTKNQVLEVEQHKAKLPDDFVVMNYMYVLGEYEVMDIPIQGTHVEQVPLQRPEYFPGKKDIDVCAVPPVCPTVPECPDPCQAPEPCGCNTCNCDTWINCQGQEMQLIQKIKTQTRKYKFFYKIRLTGQDGYFDPWCPNRTWQAANSAFIDEHGYLHTSFKSGTLYVNYQGLLQDDQGQLLVLDHDIINEYYEYAIKERIIENLMANQEKLDPNFVQRIDTKLRMARNNALSIVNTPDFAEMKRVFDMNRKAMFNKYYKMFA
jgi:hypothetical protein